LTDTTLRSLGVADGTAVLVREKDGVAVYRVIDHDSAYILKTYEKEADRREIDNYRILQTLGIRTLNVVASADSALLMEDVEQSETLRLAREDDMQNPGVAARLAGWYKQLHERGKAFVAAHGSGMYDETGVITPENMDAVSVKTNTAGYPAWELLRGNFGAVSQKIASVGRTLTYNDFYYTNMVVAKDLSAAFMFDYNLLGKGYVYADLRNVAYSLGGAAKAAFLGEYGGFDPAEKPVDDVASALTTLHFACQRKTFPGWAADELERVKDGTLERALRRLLSDGPHS
jgi:hypothetical protein